MIPAEGRPLRATTGIVPGRPLVLWAGHPEPVSRQVIAIACVAVLALIGMDRWMGLSGARMINERDKNQGTFDVTRTDEEWQAALSPKQYAVLRRHDTEYPGTSPLLNEHRPGSFVCAGCGQPLFDSDTKFESGSGWPSFYAARNNAVATIEDRSLAMRRIEIHCSRCGGHLGHLFPDGPRPTGQRYCTNGAALTFKPDGKSLPE